jgi:hypothetical protein
VPPDAKGLRARLAPRDEWRRPALRWLLALDDSGDRELVSLVRHHAASEVALVAEHARRAASGVRGIGISGCVLRNVR